MTDGWTLPRSGFGPAQARLLMLLATICWGMGNIARKTALDDLGPLSIVGWTSLLGAIAIAPFAQKEWRRFRKAVEKSGGAVLTAIMGYVSDLQGIKIAQIVPVICFGVVALYGFRGSKSVEGT